MEEEAGRGNRLGWGQGNRQGWGQGNRQAWGQGNRQAWGQGNRQGDKATRDKKPGASINCLILIILYLLS